MFFNSLDSPQVLFSLFDELSKFSFALEKNIYPQISVIHFDYGLPQFLLDHQRKGKQVHLTLTLITTTKQLPDLPSLRKCDQPKAKKKKK